MVAHGFLNDAVLVTASASCPPSAYEHPQADPATDCFQDCQQHRAHLKGQSQVSGRHLEDIVSPGAQEVRVAPNG
jgi:hypothetical protein